MTDAAPPVDQSGYFDVDGNPLSRAELTKLLRRNVDVQHAWWKAKAQPRVGLGKPPPGVRQSKRIRDL